LGSAAPAALSLSHSDAWRCYFIREARMTKRYPLSWWGFFEASEDARVAQLPLLKQLWHRLIGVGEIVVALALFLVVFSVTFLPWAIGLASLVQAALAAMRKPTT
jgi:hypothetical protein